MAQHAKRPHALRRIGAWLTVVLPALALIAAVFTVWDRGGDPSGQPSAGAPIPSDPIATAAAQSAGTPSANGTAASGTGTAASAAGSSASASTGERADGGGQGPASGSPSGTSADTEVVVPDGRGERLRWEQSRITEKAALVKRRKLARAVQAESRRDDDEESAVGPTSFRVATFNVLGNSHTVRGGNRKGWAAGTTRMAFTTGLIGNNGVDVIGFQEFEDAQYASFRGRMGGSWAVYPGRALGPKSIRFSIAYRTSEWSMVRASSVSLPYAGGNRINMPLILLERRDTGQQVYFFNVHNPASTSRLGGNARWRAVARQMMINTVNRLRAASDIPVVLTGDMNAREDVFCPLVNGSELIAAKGGSSGGACVPPPRPLAVDWIFGTDDIDFSSYVEVKSGIVNRASDHPFIYADATIDPAAEKQQD